MADPLARYLPGVYKVDIMHRPYGAVGGGAPTLIWECWFADRTAFPGLHGEMLPARVHLRIDDGSCIIRHMFKTTNLELRARDSSGETVPVIIPLVRRCRRGDREGDTFLDSFDEKYGGEITYYINVPAKVFSVLKEEDEGALFSDGITYKILRSFDLEIREASESGART